MRHHGETDMKATHKNLTRSDYTTKSGHVSLERIKGFLRINSALSYPKEDFISSNIGFCESRENEALRAEVEMKRNQARTYAGIVPPK